MSLARRYGGAGLRRGIRGSSADEWTPKSDSSAVRWWRADSGLTISAGRVTDWADQIEGAVLSEVTSSGPAQGTTINGQATLEFDGGDYLLGSGFTNVAQPVRVYVVAEITGVGSNQIVLDDGGGTANSPVLQWLTSQFFFQFGSSLATGSTTRTGASAWLLVGAGASSQAFRDDFTTALVTGNAGASATDSLAVGATNTGAAHMTGAVAEVIVTTNTNVANYRSYLGSRYGIAIG